MYTCKKKIRTDCISQHLGEKIMSQCLQNNSKEVIHSLELYLANLLSVAGDTEISGTLSPTHFLREVVRGDKKEVRGLTYKI